MKQKSVDTESAGTYRVQVLERALGILDILAEEGDGLMSAEICKRLDLHKSTAHRLLAVLNEHGYVDRSAASGRYTLGMKLFHLGSRAVANLDMRERARPWLQRLVEETGETAHLCTLDDGDSLYLEKVEADRTVRVPSIVGRRYPAHCGGAGKALLAHVSDDDLDDLVARKGLRRFTANTITSSSELQRELRAIRGRGYAIDNEEFEEGLECIGAPVRDHTGEVVAAISIAGPASRVTKDRIPALALCVMSAADNLSEELGYRTSRRRAVPQGPKEAAD